MVKRHIEEHPDYPAMGIFAGYGEADNDIRQSSDAYDEENLRVQLEALKAAAAAYIGVNRTQGMDDEIYEIVEAALEALL